MGATLPLVTFLSFAIIMAPCGEAVRRLPAPENLSYEWIDGFLVQVTWSWPKPRGLPEDCGVVYEIQRTDKVNYRAQVKIPNFTQEYLTDDMPSGSLELSIFSKPETGCKGWNESQPVKKTIKPNKPKAELVKDFKCYYLSKGFNCSWEQVDPSEDLKVYYRLKGKEEEDIKSLKMCKPEKIEGRNICSLERKDKRDFFVLVETETAMTTFEPKYFIHVPEMSIHESEASLNLTWTNPDVGQLCTWRLCLWYKECGKSKTTNCYNLNQDRTVSIPYKKCCRYEFQYNTTTDKYCTEVISDTSDIQTHGTTKTCLDTANVVTIVIPIIVILCLILSFYCFRKHQEKLGLPNLDPMTIKDMLKKNEIRNPVMILNDEPTVRLIFKEETR